MADPDFGQFKLVHKGHSFEEFHEGQVFDHHWGRTINAGDNSLFTTATLAHCPLYFNASMRARTVIPTWSSIRCWLRARWSASRSRI